MSRLGRALGILALTALVDCITWALCAGVVRAALTAARRGPGVARSWSIDHWLTVGAATLSLLTLGVATGLVLLTTAEGLLGQHAGLVRILADNLTPLAARRVLLAACGAGLAGGAAFAPAASADDSGRPDHCQRSTRCSIPLDGLPLPELPTPHRGGDRQLDVVTVRQGDSLWRISARLLAPQAGDAEVAALVQRVYALNRGTVGPDPNLIFPGMHLVAPEGQS